MKALAAPHVAVVEPERRQPGHILCAHVEALGTELFERRVHVDCVPQHDDVHHRSKRAELVFLTLTVALPHFAAIAMEYDAGELILFPSGQDFSNVTVPEHREQP